MKDFILKKINEIYNDFLYEMDAKKYYCDLKNFGFEGDNLPDYNDPVIQKYYLLRYMPAYITEYYLLYEKMFKLKFLDKNPNIISIGCGCGIDLWGAKFARDKNSPKSDIRYTGIDVVDWWYKEDLGIKANFLNADINNLCKLDKDNYNVIIFPKSIGEFDERTFLKLKDIIINTNFTCDRIILLSSLRKTRNYFDINRLAEIINIFISRHKYKCLEDIVEYWDYPTDEYGNYIRLEYANSSFTYPDDILDYMINLNNHCNGFIENCNKPCEEKCLGMNRYPVLTTSQIQFQILRLER